MNPRNPVRFRLVLALLLLGIFGLVACQEQEPPEPPAEPTTPGLEVVQVEGWTFDVPTGWEIEEPESRSAFFPRLLQLRLSGPEADVRLIAVRVAWAARANIDRWKGQFEAEEAQRASWSEEAIEVAGHTATLVELRGTYLVPRFSREAGKPDRVPDAVLLGAVWEADPILAFQVVGPGTTIDSHRDAFRAFISSAHR